MEYRRFVARTLDEAREKMVREMGTRAYILKVNNFSRRKYLGLVKEKFVEIQAGLLNDTDMDVKIRRTPVLQDKGHRNVSFNPDYSDILAKQSAARQSPGDPEKIKRLVQMISQRARGGASAGSALVEPADEGLFLGKGRGGNTGIRDESGGIGREGPRSQFTETAAPVGAGGTVEQFLRERDFSSRIASQTARIMSENGHGDILDYGNIAASIAAQFEYLGDVRIYATNPNIVFFIGPTGVGKTSTLAKIASRYAVVENKKCILATFDVRRVMATAQLERYARIMGVPFKVLYDKKELKELVTGNIEKNMIFIDTAGTSQNDRKHIEEMSEFINYMEFPKEVHLCLNASSRERDLRNVINNFGCASYDRILVTKADESYSLGSVLSVIEERGMPISWLTFGQDVPRDIISGSRENLAEKLMEEWQ